MKRLDIRLVKMFSSLVQFGSGITPSQRINIEGTERFSRFTIVRQQFPSPPKGRWQFDWSLIANITVLDDDNELPNSKIDIVNLIHGCVFIVEGPP